MKYREQLDTSEMSLISPPASLPPHWDAQVQAATDPFFPRAGRTAPTRRYAALAAQVPSRLPHLISHQM